MMDKITLLHLNDIKENMPNNLIKVLALILMVKMHDVQLKGRLGCKMTQKQDTRL